jgi:hypothetical protein
MQPAEQLAMINVLLKGNTFKFNSDRKMQVNKSTIPTLQLCLVLVALEQCDRPDSEL